MKLTAGIEGGGTKFNVGIGDLQGKIIDKIRIDTTTPEETLAKVCAYLKTKQFSAIGVGMFGPISLNKNAQNYGTILATPKLAWQGFNIYKALTQEFSCPVIIEHDVNAALLGELKYGVAKGLENAVYYTVGTGVGAGLWLGGRFHHGELHAEIGHMFLPKHPLDMKPLENISDQKSPCPFHGDACLEGLVSGPAIEKRYGIKAEHIPLDSPIWDFTAYYLALACLNTTLAYAPSRIIFGGGVSNQEFLFPKIRQAYLKLLNGYLQEKVFIDTESFIVRAALQNDPGLIGSCALAQDII